MPEDFHSTKSSQPPSAERSILAENKGDLSASKQANDTLADKIFRETYLVTHGTAKGFSDRAEHAWQNKAETAANLGIGVASALALTYLSRGGTLKATLGWGATAGMTAIGVKDSFTYLKPAYDAVVDTYNSPANFDQNLKKFSSSGGAFVFDTTMYGAIGGMGGSLIGRSVFAPMAPGKAMLHAPELTHLPALEPKARNLVSTLPENIGGNLRASGEGLAESLKANRTGGQTANIAENSVVRGSGKGRPVHISEANASHIDGSAKKLDLSTVKDINAPLNVSSKSADGLGRAMSNFAETPFQFQGQRYASVEGFYQSLKFTDAESRLRVANMSGPIAKSFGNKGTAEVATFDGKTCAFGSPEHHLLMKDVIRAKLEQHPQIATEFAATYPRPIVHDTGRRPPNKTSFSEETFTRILSELRDEFAKKPKQ